MKRRNFIKATSATAISFPFLLDGLHVGVISRSKIFKLLHQENDKVLVLIQMNGGNDGLNMVIPLDQYDNLANARSNIVLPESNILSLDFKTGLHPAMTGVKNLWDQGKAAVVNSVGYPNQNRSHFRSADIWTTGSSASEFLRTGWVGRYFDNRYGDYPDGYPNSAVPDPIAITIGSLISETCQGTISNFSMALNNPYSLNPLLEGLGSDTPDTPYGHELAFLRVAISQTNQYADAITGSAKHGKNMATYPNTNLANQLKSVALLISGGLQTKVYVCNIGGFDTHANQIQPGNTTTGAHATLLQTLSDAIAAFQEDLRLQGLEKRVIGMTFSEFGRQIKSNASNGTDHGTAAPLIVFGSCLQAGIVGNNPQIPATVADQAGVPMEIDFRNVYGSILMDWFGAEEDEVRDILFDDFQRLPLIDSCTPVFNTTTTESAEIECTVYPNPVRDVAQIDFKCGNERVKLSIVGQNGQEIDVVFDRELTEGYHSFSYDARHLQPGGYYYRLQMKERQKTNPLVKI